MNSTRCMVLSSQTTLWYRWRRQLLAVLLILPCFGSLVFVGKVLAAPVTGDYRLLVVPLNYQDDTTEIWTELELEEAIFSAAEPLSAFNWLDEASYGRLSLSGSVLDWQTLPVATAQCADYTEIQNQAAMQTLVDWLDGSVDFSAYDGLMLYAPPCPGTCGACGTFGTRTFSSEEGDVDLHFSRLTGFEGQNVNSVSGTAVHEMGHTFTLQHAHAMLCGSDSIGSLDGACSSTRAMGFDSMDLSLIRGHFNAHYKYFLGWFNDSNVVNINATVPDQVHEVALAPLAAFDKGPQMIRIAVKGYKGVTGSAITHLAVEYRQPVNFDSSLSGFFPVPGSGVVISAGPEADFPWPQVHLVDTHPDSDEGGTDRDEMADADLLLGETFIEPLSGARIEFMAVEAGRAVVKVSTRSTDIIFVDGFEP